MVEQGRGNGQREQRRVVDAWMVSTLLRSGQNLLHWTRQQVRDKERDGTLLKRGAQRTRWNSEVDPYGNTDTHYQGTVTFATSDTDPGVVLPPDYTFQPADAGMATFPGGVTLITPGDRTLTVTDTVSGITGGATVTVIADDGPGRSQGRGARSEPTATSTESDGTALDDWFAARVGQRHGSRVWVALAEASSVHRRLAVGPIEVALVDDGFGLPLA